MIPLKVHTYALFLNETNPHWRHSHEMSAYYEMKDNGPLSYDALSDQVLESENIAKKVLNQ